MLLIKTNKGKRMIRRILKVKVGVAKNVLGVSYNEFMEVFVMNGTKNTGEIPSQIDGRLKRE